MVKQDPALPFPDRMRQSFEQAVRFGRDYAGGLSRREVRRLFDEDATRAWSVLAGEPAAEKGDEVTRFLLQVRDFFLGLAFKLSPARRLLFTVALLLPLLGLLSIDTEIGRFTIYVDFSPFWFLLSIAGLTLLLALELVDRIRVRDELEVARQLQRDLMPRTAPEIAGYAIAHSYRTANEIGGDYYDFPVLADGRLVLAVGDASGHGIAAGLLMAISHVAFRTAIDLDPRPLAVLELLNRALCRTGNRRAFMTLFYGVLDPDRGELEYACAGHPFPLLRRASGELVELGSGALPLGIATTSEYAAERLTLEPGDLLVLYSDGLPEAIGGPAEDAFGFDRLRALVAGGGDPRSIHDAILGAVDRHLGGRPLGDDLALVVVRRDSANFRSFLAPRLNKSPTRGSNLNKGATIRRDEGESGGPRALPEVGTPGRTETD